MPARANFPTLFAELRALLEPFAPQQIVQADSPDQFSLDTPPSEKYPQGLFFGAVQIKKKYVSYHLMPVYVFPDLLDRISDRLRQRKQGKSCFNLITLDESMQDELAQPTAAGFARYQTERLLPT